MKLGFCKITATQISSVQGNGKKCQNWGKDDTFSFASKQCLGSRGLCYRNKSDDFSMIMTFKLENL